MKDNEQLKDNELRALILGKLYQLKDAPKGYVSFPDQLRFEGVDDRVVRRICQQLINSGYVQDWGGVRPLNGLLLQITAAGVDVVNGKREPPIAINFTQHIDDHSIHVSDQASVQAVTGDTQGNVSVSQGSVAKPKKSIISKFFAWVVGLFVKAHTGA